MVSTVLAAEEETEEAGVVEDDGGEIHMLYGRGELNEPEPTPRARQERRRLQGSSSSSPTLEIRHLHIVGYSCPSSSFESFISIPQFSEYYRFISRDDNSQQFVQPTRRNYRRS